MDFEKIEGLSFEEAAALFDDVIEGGEDTQLADCCCANGALAYAIGDAGYCRSWCRNSHRSRCSRWYASYNGEHGCLFGC